MGAGTSPTDPAPRFSMAMVPPNLTGDLHLGHGLMMALQDCLVRQHRQFGATVNYVPGFDHAGIGLYATVLHALGTRRDEPMLPQLRAWAGAHRRRQSRQMHDFGVACDWDRELYTMAPAYQSAVKHAFRRLADDGLVYRDLRDVNWCPHCGTTISDVEVVRTVRADRLDAAACGRCDTELTSRRTWQWFVRMRPLAAPLVAGIERGEVRLRPEPMAREALEWLRRIEDWCVSRQIPWGHRLPAWRCTACAGWAAGRRRRCSACGSPMRAETDVLDTWFSSSLWFLVSAGWPGPVDPDLYPFSVITTGRDILLFWLLRTLALSRHLAGRFPSDTCYLHGLVVAADGTKMSKSTGNAVTLREACDEHGSDVVRAALLAACHDERDVKVLPGQLRRQARAHDALAAMADMTRSAGVSLDGLDHWVARRLAQAQPRFAAALEQYRFTAGVELLDAFAEQVAARYVAVRRSEGAGRVVPAPLLAAVGRLFEPVMPGVASRLAGAGQPAGDLVHDAALAESVDQWIAVLDEVLGLRGAVGLNTTTEIRVVVPDAMARDLRAESWIAHATALNVCVADGPVRDSLVWRVPLATGDAAVHFGLVHAPRLRAEAVRRLRVQLQRLRSLERRDAAARRDAPTVTEDLLDATRRVRILRLNIVSATPTSSVPGPGSR